MLTSMRGEKQIQPNSYNYKVKENSGDRNSDTLSPQSSAIITFSIRLSEAKPSFEILREIKGLKPLTEVIMLTGHGTLEMAIEGMKLGAFDFLMKPCETEDLTVKIDNAQDRKADQEDRIRAEGHRNQNLFGHFMDVCITRKIIKAPSISA